jgi:hypothetical protein
MGARSTVSNMTILEEIFSQSGWVKAVIWQRRDGILQVEIERKTRDCLDPEEYWSRVGSTVILADSIEHARRIAEEELRQLPY